MSITLEDIAAQTTGRTAVLTGIEACIVTKKKSWGDGTFETNGIRFCLDGVAYQVVEDDNDGYRSAADEVEIIDPKLMKNWFPPVLVTVVYRSSQKRWEGSTVEDDCDILVLESTPDGKSILEVGTDYGDSYYPSFVMDFVIENLPANAPDLVAQREAIRLHEMTHKERLKEEAKIALDAEVDELIAMQNKGTW